MRIRRRSSGQPRHGAGHRDGRVWPSDEAELVAALLEDPTAQPMVSLLAEVDGRAVGHVLFTAARVVDDDAVVPAGLLAPLAVVPEAQGGASGSR